MALYKEISNENVVQLSHLADRPRPGDERGCIDKRSGGFLACCCTERIDRRRFYLPGRTQEREWPSQCYMRIPVRALRCGQRRADGRDAQPECPGCRGSIHCPARRLIAIAPSAPERRM